MTIVEAGPAKDLAMGSAKEITAGDREILIANSEGKFYAIGNKCTHRGCKLSNGRLKGDQVICLCHGSTFDLKTGEVVHGPATEPEPSYKVGVRDDNLQVEV
jgi:3-phenylpropionate/trans-cinnamate dioxygenase ferredoxin component